ncbi:MAG TPA: VanZ family protein [Candidatus Pygmaiobacter gallistercoris]|nr:VanZ family protein [Candidatus Pygmaiobacter gallistercoris]
MKNLLLEGYGFACCCLPPALLFFARRSERSSRGRRALFALFLCYLGAVFSITGAGTLYDLIARNFALSFYQSNLTPFASPFLSSGYLLNILLFVPLGLLAVLLWPGRGCTAAAVGCGFFFSLAIECSQLYNNRFTDLDDLTANTLGALVGALVALAVQKLLFRRRPAARPPLSPALYLTAAFLGRFLLFAELRAAGWLYGF